MNACATAAAIARPRILPQSALRDDRSLPRPPFSVDYRTEATPGITPMPAWMLRSAQTILQRHTPWSTHDWIELRRSGARAGIDLQEGQAFIYHLDVSRDPLALSRLPVPMVQADLRDPVAGNDISLLAYRQALTPQTLREFGSLSPYCDWAKGQAAIDFAAAMGRPIILDRTYTGRDQQTHRESFMVHRDPGPGHPWRLTDLDDGVPIGHTIPGRSEGARSLADAIGARVRGGYHSWLRPADLANRRHRS